MGAGGLLRLTTSKRSEAPSLPTRHRKGSMSNRTVLPPPPRKVDVWVCPRVFFSRARAGGEAEGSSTLEGPKTPRSVGGALQAHEGCAQAFGASTRSRTGILTSSHTHATTLEALAGRLG